MGLSDDLVGRFKRMLQDFNNLQEDLEMHPAHNRKTLVIRARTDYGEVVTFTEARKLDQAVEYMEVIGNVVTIDGVDYPLYSASIGEPSPPPDEPPVEEPGTPPPSEEDPEDPGTDPPTPPPPAEPSPVDAREFVMGPVLPAGTGPWPQYDVMFANNAQRHHDNFMAAPSGSGDQEIYYYDLALSLYRLAAETGNATYLQYAKDVAKKWWDTMPPRATWDPSSGYQYDIAPRGAALAGLMIYAMDGQGDSTQVFDGKTMTLWEWLEGYVRYHYNSWIGRRLSNTTLHYGLRDGGYALLFTALLAKCHPTESIRNELLAMALAGARDYYARLQFSDGGWYWGDSAAGSRIKKADGSYYLHSQPFMVGLMLEALVAVHQMTGDAAVLTAITTGCEWLYEVGYRLNHVVPDPFSDINWRGGWYFVFEPGATLVGTTIVGATPYEDPDGSGYIVQGTIALRGGSDPNSIREVRQHNGLQLHAFGYAYAVTADPQFKTMGDEMFAATFGKGSGPGADWSYALCDYTAKSYNQCYRSSGRYLGWVY